jgi:hypothetical protein
MHGGRTVVAAAVWLCVAGALRADTADEIVKRAVEAHGGEEAVAKFTVMQVRGRGKLTIPTGAQYDVTLETWALVPGKFKSVWQFTVSDKPITTVNIVNGRRGWKRTNGATEPMTDEGLAEVKEQMHAESLDKLLALRDAGTTLTPLGEDQVQGRAVVGLLVRAKDRRDVRLYFDKATGLLAKRENTTLDRPTGQLVKQEVFFSNYQQTEGVRHWTRIVIHLTGNPLLEMDFTDVQFPKDLPDATFQP